MSNGLWVNFIRTWRSHTSMQVATLAVLSGTYTVICVALLFHQNLDRILSQWGEAVQLSVYLKDDISESDKIAVRASLEGKEIFDKVEYISKDAAAKKFKQQLGHFASDLIAENEIGNPLPASFVTDVRRLSGENSLYSILSQVASELMQLNGVEDVSFGQEWVKNYASLIKAFTVSSWVLILVLISGSIFVVGNSIRHAIHQRRDEIEILELVGGTPSFVRKPYIFEGTMMGVIGAILALGLSYLLYLWQSSVLSDQLGYWALGAQFSYLNVGKALLVIVMGAGFGAFGSLLCVRKICTGWAAADRIEALR